MLVFLEEKYIRYIKVPIRFETLRMFVIETETSYRCGQKNMIQRKL